MADHPTLLAIAGTGQNGATLLCRMLGELPGFVGVGEIGRIWDKALIDDEACSCGAPFRSCPFWSRVGDVAFGGWDRLDGTQISRLREAVRLRRPIGSLGTAPIDEIHARSARHLLTARMTARVSSDHRRNLHRYAELMGRLYRGIAEVSGETVIVDSMKFPYHVNVLPSVPDVDLRFLHLVRDSRGVAHSQTKTIVKQGAPGRYRRRRNPLRMALRWDWVNLRVHALRRTHVPSILVRYEDVIADAPAQLRSIAGFAGVSVGPEDLRFIRGTEVDLPSGHLVAGNRMRLESGPIHLRPADGWRTELSTGNRRLVSVLTWPLIRRYAYVGRGTGTPDD